MKRAADYILRNNGTNKVSSAIVVKVQIIIGFKTNGVISADPVTPEYPYAAELSWRVPNYPL